MTIALDDLNASELLLLAQEQNPNVHRGLSRDLLYSVALGEDTDLPERRVDKVRLKIMKFVLGHWKQVEPLVQGCPAKTQDPRACFQCTDIQAVQCALENPIVFKQKE